MNKTTFAQQNKTSSILQPAQQGILQRMCTCGNHTVAGGECAECAKKKSMLQRKLAIGASNDPLEQEADRVADQVMTTSTHSAAGGALPRIQRYSGQAFEGADTAPASVNQTLASSGRPLEPALRQDMEQRFGHDFSRVRVHTGQLAATSAGALNAQAYTVGQDIVFGEGQYAIGSRDGQKLLAHELAHVVQQGKSFGVGNEAKLMRNIAAPVTANVPLLDYKRIATQIHEAIAGLGTDEEAVYRALQELGRKQTAIEELKNVYWNEYKVLLIDDIYDDFSGTELEYALQLLNMGTPGSKQTIEPTPKHPLNVTLAAVRIREAVERMGTDEEAIFAVLLPFGRNTLELQNEYHRRYDEDLRDRLVDEMSGTELDYALELLETPYEHYIHEGNQKLAGASFESFGDVSTYCLPEERETSAGGTKRIYWYDKDYWEPGVHQEQVSGSMLLSCKVELLPGKSAAAAIDAMFEHQDRWKIACAEFVQIVHLYALRHTLGATRFDERVGKDGLTLELRRRESTGLETEGVFSRKGPSELMLRKDTGQPDPRPVDQILKSAPIGSRVRWTNLTGEGLTQFNPWQNENTIKLGPDKFGAHGTATGIFTTSNTHTRGEVELLTARGTNPKADFSYIKANIFISEIEIFRDPSRQRQAAR